MRIITFTGGFEEESEDQEMKRKYVLYKWILTVACLTVFIFSGCAGDDSLDSDNSSHMENIPLDTEPDTEIGGQNNTETHSQDGTEAHTDAELEEQLARYRQEREDNIQEVGGLVEGGSPDESNYTFDLSGVGLSQFDTREITEGFAAARIYVTDTLGINPSTKMEVYMCVDPRILAIYEDEDKGVVSGYDNSNIFICEYCGEDNVWKYLFLVRDGKGSKWKVIHNGESYKE